MMKRSAYPLFVGLLGSFLAVPAVPVMAQEGAGELGAPTRVEEVTPTAGAAVPAPDAQVVVAVAAAAPVFRGSQMTAGGRVYELGCNAGMHFVYGPTVYVQCAGAVVVVDTANPSATTFAVSGMPTNFFEQGGRVWVELNHDTAHPVESLPSLAPQAAPANQFIQPGQPNAQLRTNAQGPVGPELPPARGEVVRFDSGEVHIRFDSVPELYAGTRVAFTSEGMTPVVGTLVTRAGDIFIARVTYGEAVPVGAVANVTNAPATGSSSMPERSSSFRLAATVRGLIGAGDDGGGGIIADIDAEWRLRAPVFLRLIMDPVGVGFGENAIGFAGAHVLAGFDSSFLAIGLGLGFQMVEADVYDEDRFFSERTLGIGTSLAFLLRVGSPEGFYVELFNAMTYVDQFRFGSLRIRAQWGLGHRNWMVIRGGGGVTRAAYGEVGFRRLLSGWSGDGAFFLTASFGGSAILSDISPYNLYAGPTFGITLEKIW